MQFKGFKKKQKEDMSYGEQAEFERAVKTIGSLSEDIGKVTKEYIDEDWMQITDAEIYAERVDGLVDTIEEMLEIIEHYGKKYGRDY